MSREKHCTHEDCQIRLDYSNMMAEMIGDQGFTQQLLTANRAKIDAAHKQIKSLRSRGLLPWQDLLHENDFLRDIQEYKSLIEGDFDDLVLIGIGGSALGAIALVKALGKPFSYLLGKRRRGKDLRFIFSDNIDPETFQGVLSSLDPAKTLFNVVSKSGETPETLGRFMVAFDWLKSALGESKAKKHVVVTTDPQKGTLRRLSRQLGLKSFSIPQDLEGRFSVFSPVGLLPAALAGIDVEGVLQGARLMEVRLQEPDFHKNPAYLSALLQYLADVRQGRNMVVLMPYSDRLRGQVEWYRQLWAESVGKKFSRDGNLVNCGSTPVPARGVSDQHSQMQIFSEGPQDKVVVFLATDRYSVSCPINTHKAFGSEDFGYLQGSSLELLAQTERISTALSLRHARRPNMTFVFPSITPCTIGQFMYMMLLQSVVAGELYQVKTFEQDGVEEAKMDILAMMGCRGYEKRRAQIEKELKGGKNTFTC